MSLQRVPGENPSAGSPAASSYVKPHNRQIQVVNGFSIDAVSSRKQAASTTEVGILSSFVFKTFEVCEPGREGPSKCMIHPSLEKLHLFCRGAFFMGARLDLDVRHRTDHAPTRAENRMTLIEFCLEDCLRDLAQCQ